MRFESHWKRLAILMLCGLFLLPVSGLLAEEHEEDVEADEMAEMVEELREMRKELNEEFSKELNAFLKEELPEAREWPVARYVDGRFDHREADDPRYPRDLCGRVGDVGERGEGGWGEEVLAVDHHPDQLL